MNGNSKAATNRIFRVRTMATETVCVVGHMQNLVDRPHPDHDPELDRLITEIVPQVAKLRMLVRKADNYMAERYIGDSPGIGEDTAMDDVFPLGDEPDPPQTQDPGEDD